MIATSKYNIYIYSLATYDLLYSLSVDEESTIDTIEIHNNELYIALSNKTVNIYSISETMLKHIKIF